MLVDYTATGGGGGGGGGHGEKANRQTNNCIWDFQIPSVFKSLASSPWLAWHF